MVHAFWERANPGGRDINDMSLFKAGEKFLPIGPPRKRFLLIAFVLNPYCT
jgi:hypothetical protein